MVDGTDGFEEGEMAQLTVDAVPPGKTTARTRRTRSGPGWLRVFVTGLALWLATVLVTFLTGNANLVPTIILVGSFLVPVTFVVYAFSRADAVLTAQRVFSAFVYGGVLGVLGASVLEAAFVRQPSTLGYLGVGLVEEAVKLAALWLLARRLPYFTARNGMVLGAAVGFGFAAFESAGYAFNALFTANGLSLLNVVETEALRGILAPVGHGLWTAVLGGALFATAARAPHGRPRLTGSLLGWFLLVTLLHGLWDASSGIAVWLTLLLTGTPTQWYLIGIGQAPNVTQLQVHLYTALSWLLLAVDAAVGLLVLGIRWHRARGRAVTGGWWTTTPTGTGPLVMAPVHGVGILR
ncbi:PrsW family glutamic-type intramembrane protease [Plantactinospora sp. B5E13]|uniref:PrsW family intramembrane metalloprotease n=1 Tax=unclassified Plantactinospora TaxID=2631981 RepID=UPI00325F687C